MMAPTNASMAKPILACRPGNPGCGGRLLMTDVGRNSGNNGCAMRISAMGMSVDIRSVGGGFPRGLERAVAGADAAIIARVRATFVWKERRNEENEE
jgi:hypothetical protein